MTGAQLDLIYSSPHFSAPGPEIIDQKLKERENLIYQEGVLIVKVAPQVVVKFGPSVTIHEAKNMIYVAKNTSVPVPTVFACYTYGPIDRDVEDYGSLFDTYIFMSFIDGQTLDTVWDSCSEHTKAAIAAQLKSYMEEIRNIGDGSYIGSVDHGPVTDQILSNHHTKGPFLSEEEFNKAIIDAYEANFPKRHIRALLSGMLFQNKHRIVFTHGDFRPRNIMVKDGKVTGIIDWELSGWYPEYWEFVKSLYVWRWQNDWYDYLVKILQPYYAEYAFHTFLAQELW
ncbi:hypothetical protein MPDQ_004267 [Monascus purpureus]|uniref:Aminoglycoside phosphotransferase domain-containing protein n=1 Tax=Monascus purpureus TaxID=5098 RepID=A0A507R1K9_MONPU|nr:hypothetical protein MPDQ_004267 [Monascus purpureus]BDD63618.1 hypothetical protein MAP00_008487 [Monascus purpureus]